MYVITRNNKRTVNRIFNTYEAARQHVRKLMRKRIKGDDRQLYSGFWDGISRNPSSIGALGYSIKPL